MSEVGSLITSDCEEKSVLRNNQRKIDFTLHNTHRGNFFREADCSLNVNRNYDNSIYNCSLPNSKFKEVDCTLEKPHEDVKSPNTMIYNEENNSYYSCVIYEDKIKPNAKLETLKYKESAIKADYDAEKIINKNICQKMESEATAIIFNAIKVIVFGFLYLLLFAITKGEYSPYIAVIMSTVMILFLINLVCTVLLYLIDHDYDITRGLGRLFKVNPLYIQKAESDKKLFNIAAELSKLRIEYSVEEYRY